MRVWLFALTGAMLAAGPLLELMREAGRSPESLRDESLLVATP
jgi:hypothetical protein